MSKGTRIDNCQSVCTRIVASKSAQALPTVDEQSGFAAPLRTPFVASGKGADEVGFVSDGLGEPPGYLKGWEKEFEPGISIKEKRGDE